jgi:hypothetical protein
MENNKDAEIKYENIKKSLLVSIPLLVMIILTGTSCKKELNNSTPLIEVDSSFTLYTGMSDPRLIRIKDEAMAKATFFGTKDEKGQPSELTAVFLKSKDGLKTTDVFYEDGRIRSIYLDNGVQMIVNEYLGKSINITIIAANGNKRLTTELSDNGITEMLAHKSLAASKVVPRAGVTLQRVPTPTYSIASLNGTNNVKTKNYGIIVNVKKCGMPSDVENVKVHLYKSVSGNAFQNNIEDMPARRIATGKYLAAFSNVYASDNSVTLVSACKIFKDVVELISRKANPLEAAELIAKFSTLVTTNSDSVSPEIQDAINILSQRLDHLNTIIDTYTNPKSTAYKNGCDFIPEKYQFNFGGIRIVAEAKEQGQGAVKYSHTANETFSAENPQPEVDIDLGSEPTISPIQLAPRSPSINQSYIASVRLQCMSLESIISISVLGTDGYKGKYTEQIGPNSPNPFDISLKVPGAKTSGVRDVITVSVQTLSGPLPPKEDQLIFGSAK